VDKGILPNVYEAIEILFSRTQQLADAISNVKAAQQDYGGAEPSIHNLPCPYVFFPVRVSSVTYVNTASGFYGVIQKPTASVGFSPWEDDSDLDAIFINVKNSACLPEAEELVCAYFTGTHTTSPYANYGSFVPTQIRYGTLTSDVTTTTTITVGVNSINATAIIRKLPDSGNKYAQGTGVYIGRTPLGWEVISILDCAEAV
jgi:hypothetical protein